MEMKLPLHHLPAIARFRLPTANGVGSYIDSEYVFHYFARGACQFRLTDKLYRLSAGDTLLIPPYLPHALLPLRGKGVEIGVVHFTYPPDALATATAPMITSLPPGERTRILGMFQGLGDTRERTGLGATLSSGGILLEMLGMHFMYGGTEPRATAGPQKSWRHVEEAMRHMHRDPARPWSLGDLAEAVDLSPNFLCRVFKSYTGQTPHGFLNLMRVERAKALLTESSLTCGEIAERVGFVNLPLFSRVFKKVTGMAPSGWK